MSECCLDGYDLSELRVFDELHRAYFRWVLLVQGNPNECNARRWIRFVVQQM